MNEKRMKELMEKLGQPNSRSLLQTLQQVAHEVATEVDGSLRKELIQLCLDKGQVDMALNINVRKWSDPQPEMLYNPTTGKDEIFPKNPRQFRHHHKGLAWLYDPYTGKPRKPSEIGHDPFGLLIEKLD